MAVCVRSQTCVAIDMGILACVLHHNADNLKTAYHAAGVTQFILNRQCLTTGPLSTASSVTATPSVTEETGMW